MTTLLIRPDLGRKAYRLRCRFRTEAFPRDAWLDKAKYAAAEAFVRDMAKQGYEYQDAHGFKLAGPFSCLHIATLPKHSWQFSAAEMLQRLRAGQPVSDRHEGKDYARTAPALTATDQWEYELAGVFIHKTILCEMPDQHEEQKELSLA